MEGQRPPSRQPSARNNRLTLERSLGAPDTLQLAQWPSEAPLPRPAAQSHVVHVTHCLSEGPLAFVLCVVATLDELGFRQTLVHTPGPDYPAPDLGALDASHSSKYRPLRAASHTRASLRACCGV